MKNRTIIGIACMLLAVAVCFGVAPLVNRAASQKIDIVCAAADIPHGRMITENDIKIVTVGAHNLSPKAVREPAQIIGSYAACDIKEDTILLDTQITDNSIGAEDVFRTLDGSKQAISISIGHFAGGVSGKLKNGDIVSVIVTIEGETAIPPELKYVRVITTTSSKGNDADNTEENEQPSTVTLLVNEKQATLLARSEVNGKLHLSLVYRGNAETAAIFLEAQEQVFVILEEENAENEADTEDEVVE